MRSSLNYVTDPSRLMGDDDIAEPGSLRRASDMGRRPEGTLSQEEVLP